jgi:hypothetical protein
MIFALNIKNDNYAELKEHFNRSHSNYFLVQSDYRRLYME